MSPVFLSQGYGVALFLAYCGAQSVIDAVLVGLVAAAGTVCTAVGSTLEFVKCSGCHAVTTPFTLNHAHW